MNKEFFIKNGTDLPLLVMKVIKNVHNDSYIDDIINNIDKLTFSMYDKETCEYKIINKKAELLIKEKECVDCTEKQNEYYIYYKFSKRDTNKIGTYIGEFTLNLNGDKSYNKGLYKLPLKENLVIYVT